MGGPRWTSHQQRLESSPKQRGALFLDTGARCEYTRGERISPGSSPWLRRAAGRHSLVGRRAPVATVVWSSMARRYGHREAKQMCGMEAVGQGGAHGALGPGW
jgi:hypothetical protein